ncbi:nucleotidyltransferase domain-containing protein [Massilia sp. W12]|uniref:nucleotidyltransferase domain-containing protein n=1 Tax=Massilia sp. W12 TaxID=3126507 RepID=UPI0030D5E2A1
MTQTDAQRAALAPPNCVTEAIPAGIHAEIMRRLHACAAEHGIRILLAVESGSRAWGFASPNSDYDVRFIYMREPAWYQAVDLEERRDVIEYPIVDEIDLNGWDLRKALRLFWNSNPAYVEWIQSPIIYIEDGALRQLSLQALSQIYAPAKGIYHYLSMAKTNYRGYLRTEMVRLKKYFYVLRPLLAARWIGRYGAAAPIEFARLAPLLGDDAPLNQAVQDLLALKRHTPELGLAPAIPLLNAFIEAELAQGLGARHDKTDAPEVKQALNRIFHAVLQEFPNPQPGVKQT